MEELFAILPRPPGAGNRLPAARDHHPWATRQGAPGGLSRGRSLGRRPFKRKQRPRSRLSGAITCERYIERLVAAGFGTLEVRARRPYRVLDTRRDGVESPIVLESVEVAAIKDPIPDDGPCVFTGKAAIYVGEDEQLDDGAGHVMARDQPLAICDKTAGQFEALGRDDLFVTPSTFFYDGGGCC